MIVFSCFCFFFFQAEDGIRDYKVTGVQTCALPICAVVVVLPFVPVIAMARVPGCRTARARKPRSSSETISTQDRKSTRLNSSHLVISYAVFCLKKKRGELVVLEHLAVSCRNAVRCG